MRAIAGMGFALFLILALPAFAADTTPASTRTDHSGFAEYLAEHQDDLAPFFTRYGDELLRLAVPSFMSLLAGILGVTVVISWGVDVLMSRGFASLYSPAFARFRQALIFATGSLVLNIIFLALVATASVVTLGMAYGGWISLALVVIIAGLGVAAQVTWIMYLYRSTVATSIGFYLAILVVHALVAALVAVPTVASRAPATVTAFMDNVVTPKLTAEIKSTRRDLAKTQAALDAVQGKSTALQSQLLEAQAEADQLRLQIEDKKHSDAYVFSQTMKVHARGDLAQARLQLIDFLGKFPNSSFSATANGQLTQVNSELAAQDAQKKQADADAVSAAAQTRADLLARANKGDVTLSEMRNALLGKSRDQVKDLFGLPSEVGPDRWTYTPEMVVNPLTNRRHGLTINFLEGNVQGVEYYGAGVPR